MMNRPMQPSDYDDGLDADGYPVSNPWRKQYVYGDESDHGDVGPEQVSAFLPRVMDRAESFAKFGDVTDSPIEDMLGAALLMAARYAKVNLKLCRGRAPDGWDGFALIPQCRWGIYRSDWAIISTATKMALLIECDGKDFHSSPEQLEHDRKKDQAAHDRGYLTLRFTGSDIHRDADGIAKRVIQALVGDQ